MTKQEALDVIKLLSAIESWSFCNSELLPSYLLDNLHNQVKMFEKIVLGDEERKSAIEVFTNPEMAKLMHRIRGGVLDFFAGTGKNPVSIKLGTKELTLLDRFSDGRFFDLDLHSSNHSSLCILVGPDGYEYEVL
jgi:hypothetical protein